ncbi:peptidase family M20/M25/M40, partial [Xylariomycetidae sp. FL0641]
MLLGLAAVAASGLLPTLASARSTGQYDAQEVLGSAEAADFQCDLPSPVDPSHDGLPAAKDLFSGDAALKLQVARHQGLVQIPSVSYDDNGEPDEDPRWQIFYAVHAKLAALYPSVHLRMTRDTVNTFGLVYTIKGTDGSLKPLMLAAHQDVVPVADASTWKYPPFSAHFDGQWLWGRGASDDKNSLTSLMSALEALLSNPAWTPKRTIILALGFDEECSGRRGAGTIGPYLEELYGPGSMAMILDEGGMGMELLGNDTLYALPAVMEKGHVDIWMDLHVNGGHSSMPFPHTGIGIMAEMVQRLEAQPWEARLLRDSPPYRHQVCRARYSPGADAEATELLRRGDLDALAARLARRDRAARYRLQTSQAVDRVRGGVKINALPEAVRVGVNHRVAPHDSIPAVKAAVLRRIRPAVQAFGLAVRAFEGEDLNPPDDELAALLAGGFGDDDDDDDDVDYYNGTLVLTSSQRTQVAPVSPTAGDVWDVFSGTLQHTFAFDGGRVVPVGELMTGNTDTRHYLSTCSSLSLSLSL